MITPVLFVASFGHHYGGGEGYLIKVVRHLDRARFRPIVLLPEEGNLRRTLEAMDAVVHVVSMRASNTDHDRPWSRYLSGLGKHVDAVCTLIDQEQIQLVHTNSNERFEGAMAAAVCGVRHVYLAHIARQADNLYRRLHLHQAAFADIASALSSRIVAVSNSVASTLSDAHAVEVIHNGIELDEFDSAAARERDVRTELGLPADSMLVSTVGRLCHDKGIDVLIESAAQVLGQGNDVHFLLVGPDIDREYVNGIRQRVADLKIADRVRLLGRRDDVPALLRQTDVFVLASRIEGHPYVLLEAMASSCGVVSTRCPGAEETIVDGETGRLVDVDDVQGLARALGQLVSDKKLRTRLAAAANERVREAFTAEQSVAKLMAVYEAVLAEPPPRGQRAAVDFFLLAAREFGRQEEKLLDLGKRVADLEATIDIFRKNPLARLLKGLSHKR